MSELRVEELSAATIVAVNNLSLRPGQEQFLAPVSYGIAATVVNPQTSWQRVVLDGDEVVGFVSASFDEGKLADNIRAFVDAVNRAKPSGAKGTYLKRAHVSSTMGPGIKLEISSLVS